MCVEEKRTSSGVAKAGLATGITGATLGVVNALGGLAGLHGWGAVPATQQCCAAPPAAKTIWSIVTPWPRPRKSRV